METPPQGLMSIVDQYSRNHSNNSQFTIVLKLRCTVMMVGGENYFSRTSRAGILLKVCLLAKITGIKLLPTY